MASVQDHTTAFLALLGAAGVTTGDHRAPNVAPPYTVVYLIEGGLTDGTASNPDADRQVVWQTTSVGAGPEQARWQADKVRVAADGKPLTVTGRYVQRIRPLTGMPSVARDDDLSPPVFYSVQRWAAWSVPA